MLILKKARAKKEVAPPGLGVAGRHPSFAARRSAPWSRRGHHHHDFAEAVTGAYSGLTVSFS